MSAVDASGALRRRLDRRIRGNNRVNRIEPGAFRKVVDFAVAPANHIHMASVFPNK